MSEQVIPTPTIVGFDPVARRAEIEAETRAALEASTPDGSLLSPAERMHGIMAERERKLAEVASMEQALEHAKAVRVQAVKLAEGLDALIYGYDLSIALGALASTFIRLGSQSIGFDASMLVLVNARAQYVAAERRAAQAAEAAAAKTTEPAPADAPPAPMPEAS